MKKNKQAPRIPPVHAHSYPPQAQSQSPSQAQVSLKISPNLDALLKFDDSLRRRYRLKSQTQADRPATAPTQPQPPSPARRVQTEAQEDDGNTSPSPSLPPPPRGPRRMRSRTLGGTRVEPVSAPGRMGGETARPEFLTLRRGAGGERARPELATLRIPRRAHQGPYADADARSVVELNPYINPAPEPRFASQISLATAEQAQAQGAACSEPPSPSPSKRRRAKRAEPGESPTRSKSSGSLHRIFGKVRLPSVHLPHLPHHGPHQRMTTEGRERESGVSSSSGRGSGGAEEEDRAF